MPITIPETIAERGKADARRHREKQREAIRKQLAEIISEESIITQKDKKTVRVPIRGLQIPDFRHGTSRDRAQGVGQGKDPNVGDIIGRTPAPKGASGKPGGKPGIDYLETEIDIAEIIEMMLEDLGLPRLQNKDAREILVTDGFRIKGLQRTGPRQLLHNRKTAKEGIRRFWHVLEGLKKETHQSELSCFRALKDAHGISIEAFKILKEGKPLLSKATKVAPFPIIQTQDLRYQRIQPKTTLHSRAVVFALMDVSGSMDTNKKYFARSMLYWLVAFLRKLYEQVEIRFIVHHATARFVEEEEFFTTGESGGTMCASAYQLVNGMLQSEYPAREWNVYVWHSSDGDDYDNDAAVAEVQTLFKQGINLFGYCEIIPGENLRSPPSNLLRAFDRTFNLKGEIEDEMQVYSSNNEATPFLGLQIRRKEDIHPAIKAFLKKNRFVE